MTTSRRADLPAGFRNKMGRTPGRTVQPSGPFKNHSKNPRCPDCGRQSKKLDPWVFQCKSCGVKFTQRQADGLVPLITHRDKFYSYIIDKMTSAERSVLLCKLAGWFLPVDAGGSNFWQAVEQLTLVERAADEVRL